MSKRPSDYPYTIDLPMRWNDIDMLGHLNNVMFYSFMEAAVITFTMDELGLSWPDDEIIPYAVESLCRFRRPVRFPNTITAGLRVEHVGNTSVKYEIALFTADSVEPAATGHFAQVFVTRSDERPTPIPDAVRAALIQSQES